MSVEIEGFEEFEDELDQLHESLDGENAVAFPELFPESFMATYTEFESIAAFFDASPWSVESDEDFEQIPEDEFDQYVDEHTGFDDWETMLSVAAREWVSRKLAV